MEVELGVQVGIGWVVGRQPESIVGSNIVNDGDGKRHGNTRRRKKKRSAVVTEHQNGDDAPLLHATTGVQHSTPYTDRATSNYWGLSNNHGARHNQSVSHLCVSVQHRAHAGVQQLLLAEHLGGCRDVRRTTRAAADSEAGSAERARVGRDAYTWNHEGGLHTFVRRGNANSYFSSEIRSDYFPSS